MKILVLDDMEMRHRWFRQNFIGEELTPVYTSDEAIAQLETNQFDTIMLDHDLAEDHYMSAFKGEGLEALEKTGYDVVKWMVENNNNKQAAIVVHSQNEYGSKRMVDLLIENGYNAQYVPFIVLIKHFVSPTSK